MTAKVNYYIDIIYISLDSQLFISSSFLFSFLDRTLEFQVLIGMQPELQFSPTDELAEKQTNPKERFIIVPCREPDDPLFFSEYLMTVSSPSGL